MSWSKVNNKHSPRQRYKVQAPAPQGVSIHHGPRACHRAAAGLVRGLPLTPKREERYRREQEVVGEDKDCTDLMSISSCEIGGCMGLGRSQFYRNEPLACE